MTDPSTGAQPDADLDADFHFAMVPEWLIFDSGVSSRALHVYAILARRADKGGECFPGRASMAKLIDCSEATIDRAITELVKLGALRVRRRGLGKTNLYTVIRARVGSGEDSDSSGRSTTESAPVPRERESQNQNQKNETSRPSSRKRRSSPEAKELTDEWWERLKAQGMRPRGNTAYVATRGIIQTILNEAVYSVEVIRQALERLGTRPPTAQRLRDQCWGVNREIEEARPPSPDWQTERYDEATGTMVQQRASEVSDHEERAGSNAAPPGGIRAGDRDSRHDVLGWEPGDGDGTRSPADRGSVDDRVEQRVPAGAEPAAASEPGGGGGAPRGDADDPLGDRGGGDRPPE